MLSDCVYAGTTAIGNQTGCMLTSAWGINAGYEHYWTPAWHTSLYGAYYAVSYGQGTGSANANLCSAAGFGNTLAGTLAVAGAGCNNNWQTWGIGARTQWDVTKTFYLGVEVLYQDLHSAHDRNRLGCRSGWLRLLRLRRRDCERSQLHQLDGQRSRSPRLPALIA